MAFLLSMRVFCLVLAKLLLVASAHLELDSPKNITVAVASASFEYDEDVDDHIDRDDFISGHKIDVAEYLLQVADLLSKANESTIQADAGICSESILAAMNSIPWVQVYMLGNRYSAAIQRLEQIRQILSHCSELQVPEAMDYASEAVLDFTRQASMHIDRTAVLLEDLHEITKDVGIFASAEAANSSKYRDNKGLVGDGGGGCRLDGTKCQFSECGKGRRLPMCAMGFAAGVRGGSRGISYTVTRADDDAVNPMAGTLRYGVNMAEQNPNGVWITFARDMMIHLREMLWVKSSTTIDGRGANVVIMGKSIVLAGVHNVILHNFHVINVPDADTVHIYAGSTQVWVDHLTSYSGKLGLVSVVQGATGVTISNCLLSNKNFNMLLGASDTDTIDQKLRVTVYRNWFKDSRQRMPHCRWGYCHVVNNLYTNWGYYAIGARVHAQVYSEGNVFSPGNKREVTPWFEGHGSALDTTSAIQSTRDLFLGGATFHQFLQYGGVSAPPYRRPTYYPPVIDAPKIASLLRNCAGSLHGGKLNACLSQ